MLAVNIIAVMCKCTTQKILLSHLTCIYLKRSSIDIFIYIFFIFYCSKVGMRGQKSPVITDDSFETLAFEVCNTDGVEGLTRAEVEQCQVSKYEYD